MKLKQYEQDLIASAVSVSLWLVPVNAKVFDVQIGVPLRLAGYLSTILFSATSFYALSKEEENAEKAAIDKEVDTQLYAHKRTAELQISLASLEAQQLAAIAPHLRSIQAIDEAETPVHPEMTETQKLSAAKTAVEDAFKKEVPPQTSEEDIRKTFPESMDATYWKAILKATQEGHSKEVIIKDVLSCNDSHIGVAYLNLLKQKFL